MAQIYHHNAILDIRRTFDRPKRMVSLQHVYRCHRVAIERNVLKLLRCNFVDSKMQRGQLPVDGQQEI